MQRFRGGLVFKAHRLCVTLNSRLESNKERKEEDHLAATGASAESVNLNDSGTNLIHFYGFQPQYLPNIPEKKSPLAVQWFTW